RVAAPPSPDLQSPSVVSSRPRTGGFMVPSRRAWLVPSVLALSGLAAFTVRADPSLLGFTDDHARTERALEQRFDSGLHADDLREWMRRLAARPHHVGSP